MSQCGDGSKQSAPILEGFDTRKKKLQVHWYPNFEPYSRGDLGVSQSIFPQDWKSSRLVPALGRPLWVSNVAAFRDDLHMAHECNHFFGHEDPTIMAILAIYFFCENKGTKLMEWQ